MPSVQAPNSLTPDQRRREVASILQKTVKTAIGSSTPPARPHDSQFFMSPLAPPMTSKPYDKRSAVPSPQRAPRQPSGHHPGDRGKNKAENVPCWVPFFPANAVKVVYIEVSAHGRKPVGLLLVTDALRTFLSVTPRHGTGIDPAGSAGRR